MMNLNSIYLTGEHSPLGSYLDLITNGSDLDYVSELVPDSEGLIEIGRPSTSAKYVLGLMSRPGSLGCAIAVSGQNILIYKTNGIMVISESYTSNHVKDFMINSINHILEKYYILDSYRYVIVDSIEEIDIIHQCLSARDRSDGQCSAVKILADVMLKSL